MPLQIRSLSNKSDEIEIEASATIRELKETIAAQLRIPIDEQRLVYAGKQLEEAVTEAWQRSRSAAGGVLAVDAAELPMGTPLTLEHYAIQKHSVVNIIVKKGTVTPAPTDAPPADEDAAPRREHTRPNASAAAAVGQSAPQGPTLEFMEPRCRDVGMPGAATARQGGGYSAGGRMSSAESELYTQLNAMPDGSLFNILGPLLEARPHLSSSLLHPAATSRREDPYSDAAGGGAAASAMVAYRRGDKVSVWSNSAQRWCDGEVSNICEQKGGKIPVGAVEVQFELGQKWIAPEDIKRSVKPR